MKYDELFHMLGFNDAYIGENRKRIEKFLDRIYVRSQADIDHAIERTNMQYDVKNLGGVRATLCVLTKETMDYVLAKDEHEIVINVGRPNLGFVTQGMMVAERNYSGKYYARGTSSIDTNIILGSVFDKLNWLIDVGEEIGQPGGQAHCSQYQAWAGAMKMGVFPVPDAQVLAGYYCDQAPEGECLCERAFGKHGGYRLVVTDGTSDHQWGSWPNTDPAQIAYQAESFDRAFETLKKDYGFEITEDDILNGMVEINNMTGTWLGMCEMMAYADPQPISQADLGVCYYLWGMGTYYNSEATAALKLLSSEIEQRIRDGIGVVPKGAPRVYASMRWTADMRIHRLIEDVGLNQCLVWFDTFPNEVFETPTNHPQHAHWSMFETLARLSCVGDSFGSLKQWAWITKTYHIDGFIHMIPMFCRPYTGPDVMGKDYVQKNCDDIPYLLMEGDGFDSRNYNPEMFRTRLESFREVLTLNQALKK